MVLVFGIGSDLRKKKRKKTEKKKKRKGVFFLVREKEREKERKGDGRMRLGLIRYILVGLVCLVGWVIKRRLGGR